MSKRKQTLPPPKTAREVAVRTITEIQERQAYSNLELKSALAQTKLSRRDAALATELVYGTIGRLHTIDWMLAHYLSRPLHKLEGWVLSLLRISFYQLSYLNRIPDRAVVHEAVEIAKAWGHKGIAGMVNGVLRSRLREPEKVIIPPDLPTVTRIALTHSHPEWMVAEWMRVYGEAETEAMCAANNEPPAVSLRANALRATRDELMEQIGKQVTDAEIAPSVIAPEGVVVHDIGSIAELPAYASGSCTVQDESSMLVARALAPQAGMNVLDTCAAPGGKTTHLAELMKNKGEIIALDVHPHKIKLIEENAFRLGISIIESRQADAREASKVLSGRTFDRILVDAPCSGLGVIRRKPDIKWHKWQEDAAAISEIQYEILCSAARLGASGTKLVYSTCTVQPEENQQVIERFLAAHPDWELDGSLAEDMPDVLVNTYPTLAEGYMQILPHHFSTDGFFISRLKMKQ